MSIATENLPLPHRHCHEGSISARVRRFQKKWNRKPNRNRFFKVFGDQNRTGTAIPGYFWNRRTLVSAAMNISVLNYFLP
jgi:hypothetical protein